MPKLPRKRRPQARKKAPAAAPTARCPRNEPDALAAKISPTARIAVTMISFGSRRCLASIAPSRRSVGAKTAPRRAWPVSPNLAKLAMTAAPIATARAVRSSPVGKRSMSGGRSLASVDSEAGGSCKERLGTLISR